MNFSDNCRFVYLGKFIVTNKLKYKINLFRMINCMFLEILSRAVKAYAYKIFHEKLWKFRIAAIIYFFMII